MSFIIGYNGGLDARVFTPSPCQLVCMSRFTNAVRFATRREAERWIERHMGWLHTTGNRRLTANTTWHVIEETP